MAKYLPHGGYFYSDISDGSDLNHIDFCFIIPENSSHGVMILKSVNEVAVYDFKELRDHHEDAKVLNYKKFNNKEEAYSKMMKWVGKMVKKSVDLDDGHISRYFSNKQDQNYGRPFFVFDQDKMKRVYNWMDSI